ncbi:MAG: universal stress protein [Campylobacterales bacterium]
MQQNKIFACVDGSELTNAICDYSIFIGNRLEKEVVLLNTVEHTHTSKTTNLSGNIGLGTSDELLEELANEEAKESKELIAKGKEVLKSCKNSIQEKGFEGISTMQRHGSLSENLLELENQIRVLLIGLKGEVHEKKEGKVGEQVEEIIRGLHVPTLLVNSSFRPIKKVMIAYDGSASSKKALDMVASTPIFGNVERHLVSVNKSDTLLEEAKKVLSSANIEAKITNLEGDPLDELIKYKQENEIDIVAMGAFSHGKLKSVLFGSFTHKMLTHIKIPLLLLR